MKVLPDACVIIAAGRGDEAESQAAINLLSDPSTELVVSSLLRLEALAPAIRNGFASQQLVVEAIFDAATEVPVNAALCRRAFQLAASTPGLDAMDALHAATAITVGAELVTLEGTSKPLFRVPGLRIRRL